MIEELILKRNKILSMFESLKGKVSQEAIQESGLSDSLQRLRNSSFRIALVAPFSAGKSTFVNALIGKDLLSMNVLSETAAITTLKYGKQKKVEVLYRNGKKEVFPNSGRQTVTDEELQVFLREKTTVSRDKSGNEVKRRVEETIEAVNVYWDINLCKGGVEIVDTPGLFARHSDHDLITAKVLPTVNAILFLIEPDNVGEKNFLEVISDYVEDAKNSNLDLDGKHIFFIINKIDQFTEEEIMKAREELHLVVSPLLKHPQILGVSSYFAMKARMFENGDLQLIDLKRDSNISFTDDEGFTVSGRQLTEDDIQTIKVLSRIEVIESELAAYFAYKMSHIVNEAIESLFSLCRREIKDSMELVQFIKKRIDKKEKDYDKQLVALKEDFNKMVKGLTREIKRSIFENFEGTSSGKSKIEEVVQEVKNRQTPLVVNGFGNEMRKFWSEKSETLTEENSETVVNEYLEKLILKLQTKKKYLIQKSFQELDKNYEQFVEGLMGRFSSFESNVNQTFSNMLDLPSLGDRSSFFNKEQMLNQVRIDIEALFENTSYDLSSKVKERIQRFKEENTSFVRAPGLLNRFKALFGRDEKVRVFDTKGFTEDIGELIREVLEYAEEEIRLDANAMSIEINKRIIGINEKFQKQIFERVESYQSWRERTIAKLVDELQSEKGKALGVVDEKERLIQSLEKTVKELEKFYEDEFNYRGEPAYAI